MTPESAHRIDAASRVINASPQRIYQAYIDPGALAVWLPPKGMTARIDAYDPQEGGSYQFVLTHDHRDHSTPGKTSKDSDVVRGRFVELIPNQRIVQTVVFESEDPAFAGEMRMTWTLTPVSEGTDVAVRCEQVPRGIGHEDHQVGLASTLENLAAFIEGK